jgi:small subunit ribosomal protein S15
MAKMHSRKKGASRSRPPMGEKTPKWCDTSKEELEKVILKLRDTGMSPAMIGLTLRDQYGIPSVKQILGKNLTEFLKDNGAAPEVPEDLGNLMVKALKIRRHLKANKKDVHNNRSLQLSESKIRRLVRYYQRVERLPREWEYKPETAEILIS